MRYASIMFAIAFMGAMITLTPTCSSSDDSSSSDESGDKLTIGDDEEGEASGVDLATADVKSTRENMVPGSLEIDESAELIEGNPCEGIEFLACQPLLMQLYLKMAKSMMSTLEQTLEGLSPLINKIAAGDSGEMMPTDVPSIERILYKVESAQKYKVVAISTSGPFLYLNVDRTSDARTYTMIMNTANAPDDEAALLESDAAGVMHIKLTYSNADDFDVNVRLLNLPCDSNDVQAPQNIGIDVLLSDGIHKGKAMLYLPRWMGEQTCDDEPSTSSEMFMFTDFVGHDSNSTANFYLVKRSTTSSSFAAYSFADFCTNFGDCGAGNTAFGGSDPVTNYPNPACINKTTSTFGDSCSGLSVDSLSDDERWIRPASLYDLTVDLPEEL